VQTGKINGKNVYFGIIWYFEGYAPEIIDRQSQINASALCIAMAKDIPDDFNRNPLPKQMNSIGMTKTMGTLIRNIQTTMSDLTLKCFYNGGWF